MVNAVWCPATDKEKDLISTAILSLIEEHRYGQRVKIEFNTLYPNGPTIINGPNVLSKFAAPDGTVVLSITGESCPWVEYFYEDQPGYPLSLGVSGKGSKRAGIVVRVRLRGIVSDVRIPYNCIIGVHLDIDFPPKDAPTEVKDKAAVERFLYVGHPQDGAAIFKTNPEILAYIASSDVKVMQAHLQGSAAEVNSVPDKPLADDPPAPHNTENVDIIKDGLIKEHEYEKGPRKSAIEASLLEGHSNVFCLNAYKAFRT